MSTARKFARETTIYGLTTLVQRLLNSLLTPLYTRAYLPKVYGIFSTMFSYASIVQALLAFGMETTFFRYINKFPDRKKQVYSNGFWIIFTISICFLFTSIPLIHTLAGLIKIGSENSQHEFAVYTRYFIGILVLDAWCVIPFAKLRAEGRPIKYGVIKLINIVVNVSLNLFFILWIPFVLKHRLYGSQWFSNWYDHGWVGYVFLSNLIASAITLLLLLPEFMQLQVRFDRTLFRGMTLYSGPILIANLSYLVNENLDKILLGKLLPANVSEHEVGVYSACARLSIFLSLFNQAFRMGAEPFFFSHSGKKNAGQTYARIMDYFVITMCLIFLGVVANIEFLKHYVDNKAYWIGLNVVPPLLFGYISLGIYMNLSVWYKLSDQTRYGLYISGAGAILTVLLNVLFIPRYSYMASAWASFAAYTLMMILSYFWGQRNYPIPYRIGKNISYMVVSAFLVYLSFYVFNRNLIIGNSLLIAFASVTLYLEWADLKAIFIKS